MALLGILATLISPITEAFNSHQERKAVAQTQRVALLADKDSYNHQWEIAALEGDGWELSTVRLLAYLELTICTFIAISDPSKADDIWTALAGMPEYIIGMKLTAFAWAFGSSPIKNAAAGLVTTFTSSKSPTAKSPRAT